MSLMRLTIITAILFASTLRAEPPQWDWLELYDHPESWNGALSAVQGELESLQSCEGSLGAGGERLTDCLALRFRQAARLTRLAAWVRLYEAQYPAAGEYRDTLRRVAAPYRLSFARLEAEAARLSPEHVAGPAAPPGYARWHGRLHARVEHVPAPAEQAFVLALEEAAQHTLEVRTALAGMPLNWPVVTLSTGEREEVNPVNYAHLMWRADRDDRRRISELYWTAWDVSAEPLARLLEGHYRLDARLAAFRHYPGTLAAALDLQGLPADTLSVVRFHANAGREELKRYFRLRGLALDTGQLAGSDLHHPLRALPALPLERAAEILAEALEPLRGEIAARVRGGMVGGWVQNIPGREGFVVDAGPGLHPFIGLDYRDDVPSLLELARLWGTALTVHLSAAQPAPLNGTWPLVQDTVATVAELLVLDHLRRQAEDAATRLAWLAFTADFWYRRFFEPAVRADFERTLRERVAQGDRLTAARVNDRYHHNLRRILPGFVEAGREWQVGWTARADLHVPYASLRQALATAAAAELADGLLRKGGTDTTAFRALMAAGRSDTAAPLLAAAGADLSGTAPYERVARALTRALDEMTRLAEDPEQARRDAVLQQVRQQGRERAGDRPAPDAPDE